ncbi:MAG: hypothetical protein IJZ15_03175 [Oscillospiraceae bacterium]|nr:hypothetical protein [Oscillospiraceae bacterium]
MKIKSAIRILLVLLLSVFICTAVSADDEVLTWAASEETKTITVVEGSPVTYRYIPSETGQYAIKRKTWTPMDYELHCANGDYMERENWSGEDNYSYDIYNLTAGTEYLIWFNYNGMEDPQTGSYTENVTIAPWDNSLILPDYPYIKDNQKITVTLADEECEYYLYSPAESGTYCVGRNTSNIRVNLSPVVQAPNHFPHEPEHLESWNTDTQEGSLFYLEKGNLYLVCIQKFGFDGNTVTDTAWIRPGEAPKNEYPVWDINDTKTVSLKKDEIAKYYLTPSASGKYMVRTTGCMRFEVLGDAGDMLGTEFMTSDGTEGVVFDLVAGKQYTVMLQEWASPEGSVTGTFKFEKVGTVKSASIYVANFHSDTYFLGIDIDPICGCLEGVTWSVSDPTVFNIVYESDTVLELGIRKAGTATITAKVGNISASIELTAPGKLPILKEGKTLNLTIGGTAAEFTPAKSGKYQFTLIPNREMLFSVYENVEEDPLYFKEAFSEKLVFTLNLDAGVTYELVQLFGRSSVSVKYTGGSSSQGSTTPPTSAPTQPATAAPTSPTQAPTEATQATEPVSTDAAAPSAPTEGSGDQDTPISSQLITKDDIDKAIDGATENVLSFSTTQIGESFRISADALQVAADKGCSIAFDFPGNIAVQLDNAVLKSLSKSAAGENICIETTQQLYTALNEDQQKALEGKSLVCLLDVELTAGDTDIHDLGGTAQITFSNIDTSKDLSVLYLAEDGSVEVMDITSDGSISFCTDHFSHYALILNNGQTDAPNNRWILPAVIAFVVIAGGGTAAFLVIRKKKK